MLEFPEVLDDHGKFCGFDIIIGNPPYIQLQADGGKLAKLYEPNTSPKGSSRNNYTTYARTGDIYCLFYERGCQLLKPNGLLCFITSNKWMRAGYGEKLRQFLSTQTTPNILIDFAGIKVFENATVDTNILLFSKALNDQQKCKAVSCQNYKIDDIKNLSDFVQLHFTKVLYDTSDSWVILSDIEQSIKSKIEAIGTPLKKWDIQINYGIKTGYNDAFIITTEKRNEILAHCLDDAERERTAELIRPILRGRDIKRYSYDWAELWLIATFPSKHYDIEQYPSIKEYLMSIGTEKLEQSGAKYFINGVEVKSRKKTNNKWYETQDNIGYWDDFNKPKIVYAELARTGNAFTLDMNNQMISNTSYMITFDKNDNDECKLYCLLGFLNSLATLFYLDVSCSRFDENGWRWLRQYVENIPIPQIISIELYNEVANALKTPTDDIIKKINNLIFAIIGLDLGEINYLERKFAKY